MDTKIQEQIIAVVRSMPVQSVFLFGSYARNEQDDLSDIDLLVSVDDSLKGILFYDLLDKLVTATGKQIDLIEASEIKAGSDFAKEIEKSGVLIYERKIA